MRMLRPTRPRGDTPSALATWADVFDLWGRATRRTWLTTYQLGYLQPRVSVWRRRRPPLPLLQLLVRADELVDFADPATGVSGVRSEPPPERVLTLWADDLVTVHHGTDWIYVLDPGRPFTRSWLDLVVPRDRTEPPPFAVVTASTGPTPSGEFRVRDLDATTRVTRVRVADRRRDGVTGLPEDVRTGRARHASRPTGT